MPEPADLDSRLARVQLLLLDVDGVLTDGGVTWSNDGVEQKTFNIRDGLGLRLWQRAGCRAGIVTGRSSRIVQVRAEELGIGIVRQARGEHFEPAIPAVLGERARTPAGGMSAAIRHDPDLEQAALLVFQVVFGMADAGARAHHLDIARLGPALVAQAVLVGNRALADIGDDLHILVRVRRKAALRRDPVIVPHSQRAPVDPRGIVIVREGKVVAGIQPAVVCRTQRGEGAKFDHRQSPGPIRQDRLLSAR